MNFVSKFIKKVLASESFIDNENTVNDQVDRSLSTQAQKSKSTFEASGVNLDVDRGHKEDDIKRKKFQQEDLIKKEKQVDTVDNLDIDMSGYAKELAGYLQNNTDLDRSLLKMSSLQNISTKEKPIVKIKKDDSYKSIKVILLEFVVGVVLIFFTMNYVQSQPAEKKFLDSSVQLWINTFQKFLTYFGGVFTKDADKIYLQKKENLLNQLIEDEKKVLSCLSKETDTEKQKYLNQLYMKIKLFEQQLSDPNYTPLDKFIQQYDQYNLYVYSLNEAVNKECKQNNKITK